MGIPEFQSSEEAFLFAGTLFGSKDIFDSAFIKLRENFGEIFFQSLIYPWNYSRYYEKELGTLINRCFLFFKKKIDPCKLSDIKLLTNKIEMEFSLHDRRRINLDPGYITLSKVVLASTKNYSHRIYIGKGIYAEVTLIYKHNSFHPLPYTYKDYSDKTGLSIFNEARNLLKKHLGKQ